jgi:SAM-dependent methyltransferase
LGKRGRVLEAACGAGFGLDYLAERSSAVVAGDITEENLRAAQRMESAASLVRFDACALPFRADAFDTVVMLEAIYYLPDASEFVEESHRVLAPKGVLLLGTVNSQWNGFVASRFSTTYPSGSKLERMLRDAGFLDVRRWAAFSASARGASRFIDSLRRVAVKLDVIPGSLRPRELLKRIFYGRLVPLRSPVQDGIAELEPLVPIGRSDEDRNYKIIYLVGRAV